MRNEHSSQLAIPELIPGLFEMSTWTYELNKTILYIEVKPDFTNDLLPAILSHIFKKLPLPKAEGVRTIQIVRRTER